MGLTGVFCGIGAGLCWACFILCLRKLKDQEPLQLIMFGHILIAVGLLYFVIQSPPAASALMPLGLLGVVQWGIPALLFAAAIKHVKAVQAVVTQTIEPVLNPLWVFFAVGEVPGFWALIGGSIVIITVLCHGIASAAANAKAR
jgi:drug/metabolite transporter (DMT)-like permease